METKYADSVKVTLTKDRMSFHVSFNGSKQDFFERFNIHDLLPEDKESFIRSHEKWNWATSGLFIPDNDILCFVMIIESLFSDKYKIEYEWIGGEDPYKAWKDEQKNMPLNTVY